MLSQYFQCWQINIVVCHRFKNNSKDWFIATLNVPRAAHSAIDEALQGQQVHEFNIQQAFEMC